MNPEEASQLNVSEKSDPELEELFKRLGAAASGPSQRAFGVAEVPTLLQQGWEFVAPLGPNQAVLRAPRTPVPVFHQTPTRG